MNFKVWLEGGDLIECEFCGSKNFKRVAGRKLNDMDTEGRFVFCRLNFGSLRLYSFEIHPARTGISFGIASPLAPSDPLSADQVLAADEWLREQEKALRQAVEQTEASRKLAVYSYQLGMIEILTLLDSYRSTLNAQSAHISVKRQLLNNRINLFLALGGGV